MSFAVTIGAVGVGISAIGVGASLLGGSQAAGAQSGIAGQNADIYRANAELDRRAAIIQANGEINAGKVDKQNAELSMRGGQIDEANARLEKVQGDFVAAAQIGSLTTDAMTSRLDSVVGRRNAKTLTSYARTVEATGRDRMTRLREDGRRAMGIVRNKVAKSGVVMEGSPLIVAGENAANIELAAQDVNFETRTTSRTAELGAQDELSKSRRSILQMRQSTRNARTVAKGVKFAHAASDFKIAGAQITQQAAEYASDAADFRISQGKQLITLANDRFEVSKAEADVIEAGGQATASSTRLASYGTALSGAADVASGVSNLLPPPTPKPAPAPTS